MTAMPAAPARAKAGALPAVTPPMPITGVPDGASRASRPNPSAPSGGAAAALLGVGEQGPAPPESAGPPRPPSPPPRGPPQGPRTDPPGPRGGGRARGGGSPRPRAPAP